MPGELQADKLSKVSLSGEWISGDKPSKEISFHRALYQNNPACKAVVHLHCTYLTALSCLQGLDTANAIKPFTPYVVMRVGQVPVVPYYRPGDLRLAEDLGKLAPSYKAFLLANHGPVVTGEPAGSREQYRRNGRCGQADFHPRQPPNSLFNR